MSCSEITCQVAVYLPSGSIIVGVVGTIVVFAVWRLIQQVVDLLPG